MADAKPAAGAAAAGAATPDDAPLTAEQADFLLDWLDADMDSALEECEETDDNGRTVYELAGASDAKSFLSDLVEALTPLATPVDDGEEEVAQ
jgi:hypothetical protein